MTEDRKAAMRIGIGLPAAGRTERVDLVTTVLSIGWRNNPILVAKQLASLDLASGGRLLAGLGLGGWPEDYLASQVPQAGSAAGWDSSLAAMRQVWDGKLRGQGGPTPELPEGRPAPLFGGLVPAAYRRAVAHGQGWVARCSGCPCSSRARRPSRRRGLPPDDRGSHGS
jgi:alkanesulfonate monooxygenase SsuD/methylene tetrahydromethanopterin reductase-like flavin-dependent oxidoreductase (luciferase family)